MGGRGSRRAARWCGESGSAEASPSRKPWFPPFQIPGYHHLLENIPILCGTIGAGEHGRFSLKAYTTATKIDYASSRILLALKELRRQDTCGK